MKILSPWMFIFALILWFVPGVSHAALTGFMLNGNCYATSDEALLAYSGTFPVIGATQQVSLVSSSFVSPSTISVTTQLDSWSGSSAVQTETFTLAACDPAVPIPPGKVFDPMLGAAFWSFAMTFIFGLFLLARNAATIIDVVKNF